MPGRGGAGVVSLINITSRQIVESRQLQMHKTKHVLYLPVLHASPNKLGLNYFIKI